jgi:hypothetical protein
MGDTHGESPSAQPLRHGLWVAQVAGQAGSRSKAISREK